MLRVDGAKLVDDNGDPVQLRGISTHGIAWYPEYVNRDCFCELKYKWGIDVIRLAMYTAEKGGYCTGGDRGKLKKLIKLGVRYATELGLYVIIDWHILSDGNPNLYLEEAKEFFDEMSGTFAHHANVIYEICNEPNGVVAWGDIKRYAEQVCATIRRHDKTSIILVGTPNWSQGIKEVAKDPIVGFDNVMYTLHFYATTHGETLRQEMIDAVSEKCPVFVSEFSICEANGNGTINLEQAKKWMDVLNQYKVSYVAWNLSNKAETAALLANNCHKLSGFSRGDLSESGKWLFSMLQKH